MTELPKEERIELALQAFDRGLFISETACAKAFDMPKRTFINRFNRATSRREMLANY